VNRILIVDDEEANLDLLSRRLCRAGYDVECAESGEVALKRVEGGSIDLVLLDQMMPGLSGLDVLRKLRSIYSSRQLPVIMVTALSESSRIAEALDLGANDYVTKPLDFQVALARIRAQLANRQADCELRKSEERYALVTSGAGKAVWDWDLVTNLIYYSPEWFWLLGLEPHAKPNQLEIWFSLVHPSDLDQVTADSGYH
jgi:DNA-binding response OmpR family regulator